jgi:hypothetical protein
MECMDEWMGECRGEVMYRQVSAFATPWPRCDKHFALRMERRQKSMEYYADSDVPPSWFDPTIAGERWDEDD